MRGRGQAGGGDEIDGWRWRIVSRDKEDEKTGERTGRRDKTYRGSKWKYVLEKPYSSYSMIT